MLLIVQNLCNHLDDKEIKWFAEKHKYKMGSCICQGRNVVRKVKIDNSKYNHLRKRIQSSQKKSVKQTDIPDCLILRKHIDTKNTCKNSNVEPGILKKTSNK